MKDYYRILEVSEYASDEVIKNAYKTLSKKYHPDLHKNQYKIFEQKMKDINEAYNVLIDIEKRKEYDNLLKQEKSKLLTGKVIPTTEEYFSEKNEREQKFINSLNLNKIIVFGIIVCILMLIFLTTNIFKIFHTETLNIKNVDVGITENYIIEKYGEPINQTSELLVYENFIVTVNNGLITGWINIYDELNLGEQKKVKENDFRIGEPINKIIDKKGNPDVLLEKIAIYDNIVIYLNDGYIENVKTLK